MEGAGSAFTSVKHLWKITRNCLFHLVSVWCGRRGISFDISKIIVVDCTKLPFLLDYSFVWKQQDQLQHSKTRVVPNTKWLFLLDFSNIWKAWDQLNISKTCVVNNTKWHFYSISKSFRRREFIFYILIICVVGNTRSPFLPNFSVDWKARDHH